MQDIQIEDLVKRLLQTRADMLGTDDEEHYFDVHDAATAIQSLQERVKELEADAARWHEVLKSVRGERIQATHYRAGEMFRFALPHFFTYVNLMQGAVANHFRDHVDRLIAQRAAISKENKHG